jgi:SAM-dependent methyltransferase
VIRIIAAFCCVSLACASAGPRETTPEQSVSPGINESFLSEDLDVGEYKTRFEGESREVYALREPLADALMLETGDAVADIGAGTGFFLGQLSSRVGAGGRVYAVEIAPRFVEHLRERAASEGLENVTVVHGRGDSVELPEASIDLAWVCDVYHHFEYPQSTLASLMRAIRPGGHLVVVDFHRVEGESPEWLVEHVRAGQEVFRAEIEQAGFVFESEPDVGLSSNYMLRFRRP